MADVNMRPIRLYDLERGDVVDFGDGPEVVEGWSEGSALVGGVRLFTDKRMRGWPEGRCPSRNHMVLVKRRTTEGRGG